MKTVAGVGRKPSRFMLVGDAPSKEDARIGRPFTQSAGKELDLWLPFEVQRNRYSTLLVKQPTPGFRDPKPEEVDYWAPQLEEELEEVQPEVIITFGAFSCRWALGETASLDVYHGRPRTITIADKSYIVFPCHHPAGGVVDPRLYTFFWRDMQDLGLYLQGKLRWKLDTSEVSYVDAEDWVVPGEPYDAVDTEGVPHDPISIQISQGPRTSILIDCDRDDWGWNPKFPLVFHNAIHDMKFLEAVGISIDDPEHFEDTMLLARACGDMWAGLKSVVYRMCGMQLREYMDVVRPHADAACREWLEELDDHYTPVSVRRFSKKTGKELKPKVLPKPGWVKAAARCLAHPEPSRLWRGQSPAIHNAVEDLGVRPLPHFSLREVPKDEFTSYAGADPDATGRIFPLLWKRHVDLGLEKVYQIDKGAVPMLKLMEQRGMRIDPHHFHMLKRQLEYIIDTSMEAIHEFPDVPEDYSPTSSQQTSKLLYYNFGLRPGGRLKRTKSGLPTTDDSILQAVRHQHPVVPLILGVRECAKLLSSYVTKLPKITDANDVYYPSFGTTVSGRLSEAMLLLIPKHSGIKLCNQCGYINLTGTASVCPDCGNEDFPGMGKMIRKGFIPHVDGNVFGSWDLSQIELRVLASMSQDPGLLAAYQGGVDLHARTAHMILGAPERKEDQDPSRHRLPAKTTNFSIAMGITGEGLAREIKAALASAGASPEALDEWTADRCDDMLKEWYTKAYPVAGQFLRDQANYARQHGYVKDFMGRRRWLPSIWSPNRRTVEEAERQAQSYGMQAGAQEVAKTWQRAVYKELVKPRTAMPTIMVHDDNVMEFHPSKWDEVNAGMIGTLPQMLKDIPVEAEGLMGKNWGEL